METVKIRKGTGYVIINKSDFDPAKHALYGTKPAAPLPPSAGAGVGSPDLGAAGGSHDAGRDESAKKGKGK